MTLAGEIDHIVDVAIVGAGPVGMVLALLLEQQGVSVALFNTELESRMHPKGSTQNARTMEHYRRLGLSGAIRALGLPPDYPTDVRYLTRLNGFELARLSMPSEREKQRSVAASDELDQFPEPILRANQMYVENLVFERAKNRPGIDFRRGWTVLDFDQDADFVRLTACPNEGQAERWRCQYLVGCDGARSMVRRGLGIAYSGFSKLDQAYFGGAMLATYLRAPTLHRTFLADRPAFQYWIVNAEMRTTLIALDGHAEFLMFTKLATPSAPVNPEAIVEQVQRSAGAPIPVELIDHSPWTAGVALVAERFGRGRVVLAGDAAHLFTPTGGFGMNTGIDDAANLSWKLAAAVKGWGGHDLLASYEIERKFIAERNTRAARDLARNVGDVAVTDQLEENTAQGAVERAAVGEFLQGFGEQFASVGVQLGARYDGSPIVASDEAAPAETYSQYIPTSIPGGRTPHVWLDAGRGSGSSLFDRLGPGFTLLRLGGTAVDDGSIAEAAKARRVPLTVLDVPSRAARDLYERDLVLVRSDQHVAWRGNAPPADAGRLIECVTGGSHPSRSRH
ncbi:monooxygenase [Bradyrhizobium sp. KBS0727]|nr:monooxygenase [Bradyrhizobium sp. KBS0725]QDW47149.1 monooxygenase [Bradyrhizobium sp. KBS0727]